MIDVSNLESLVQRPESATLDLKRELYNFVADPDRAVASLVKDVCAMINTIRTHTSYIIFGVDAIPGYSNQIVGLNTSIDEGILQDKVKMKITPKPEFAYYTLLLGQKVVGVMEFPLRRYESPVAPTINMQKIKSGTIYYRQGSTNTEASNQDVIRIYEWLRSLPAAHTVSNKHNDLIELLSQLQQVDLSFAPILPKMLSIGTKYLLNDIVEFSYFELKGIKADQMENADSLKYRLQKVFIDFGANFSVNNNGFSASQIREALRGEEHFIESNLHMNQSINEMEAMIADMAENKAMIYGVLESNSAAIMPWYKGKDTRVRVYLFPGDLINTVRRIRQKAIDLVMAELQ